MRNPFAKGGGTLPDGAAALEGALRGESADVLGRLGAQLTAALDEVRRLIDHSSERVAQEYAAAALVWKYFVQREAMGLRRHEPVIEAFEIPRSVLAKVGASPPPQSDVGSKPVHVQHEPS